MSLAADSWPRIIGTACRDMVVAAIRPAARSCGAGEPKPCEECQSRAVPGIDEERLVRIRACASGPAYAVFGEGNIFQRLDDTADVFIAAGYADLRCGGLVCLAAAA